MKWFRFLSGMLAAFTIILITACTYITGGNSEAECEKASFEDIAACYYYEYVGYNATLGMDRLECTRICISDTLSLKTNAIYAGTNDGSFFFRDSVVLLKTDTIEVYPLENSDGYFENNVNVDGWDMIYRDMNGEKILGSYSTNGKVLCEF